MIIAPTNDGPDSDAVLQFCRRSLGRANFLAIEHCARLGLGERRALNEIQRVAAKYRADEKVVCAAMLFLPNALDPAQFVDVTDLQHDETADLPKDLPVVCAFALARLAWGSTEHCPIASTPQH